MLLSWDNDPKARQTASHRRKIAVKRQYGGVRAGKQIEARRVGLATRGVSASARHDLSARSERFKTHPCDAIKRAIRLRKHRNKSRSKSPIQEPAWPDCGHRHRRDRGESPPRGGSEGNSDFRVRRGPGSADPGAFRFDESRKARTAVGRFSRGFEFLRRVVLASSSARTVG